MSKVEDSDSHHDLEYFKAIPWTREVLTSAAFTVIPTPSRKPKKSTEDAMFAETLNTKDTVPAWLALRKRPLSNDSPITELRFLLSLGYAVNGWPNIAHGGMIACLMDEAMGTLLQLNARASNRIEQNTFTAYLKTTYLQPIPTPSVIMATARLGEVKGRKIVVNAVIENEKGDTMATGEALFIQPKKPRSKL